MMMFSVLFVCSIGLMSENSEEIDDKPNIASTDDNMESDAMKELNFLLSGNKNIRIDETPVFNIRLIAEVKSRPYLYDQSDEGYNLIAWRNTAWAEIAETLETTADHVKTRWKTLRDRYKKEEKKERLSKKPSSWVFQKPLRFIQAHLKDRHVSSTDEAEPALVDLKAGNMSPLEATINFIENELRNADAHATPTCSVEESSAASTASSSSTSTKVPNVAEDASAPTPPLNNVSLPVTPSPSSANTSAPPNVKRARHSISDSTRQRNNTATSISNALSLFAQMPTGSNTTASSSNPWNGVRMDEEEDEIFGRMIALKLSKLDPRTKELAKMQVLKAIFDAQFGS